MAFWSRLRHLKLKFNISSNNLIRQPMVANQCNRSRTLVPALNNPNCTLHSNLSEFYCNVRFYAAPFQANQKEERDTSGPRLNEDITAPSVRLVLDDGHHFVVSRLEALSRAKSLKMDLVEVDRNAKPPVCKIYDYRREKYVQQTKEKERAKSKKTLKKGGSKEVIFAAKIKQKDLQIKADMVKRLMESGYRVKCTAVEPTKDLNLETLLSRFSALIQDIAVEETGPQIENKQAYIVVRHVKFGPPKKAGKKANQSKSQTSQENSSTTEAGSETAEESSNEEAQTTKSEWAAFDGDDDGHSVFDIDDNESVQPRSSKNDQAAAVLSRPSPHASDRNQRPAFEPAATSTPSSPSSGVPNRYARDSSPFGNPNQTPGNRYAKDSMPGRMSRVPTDPIPGRPSRIPTGTNGNGAGNRFNGACQHLNQGRQQQFASPPIRPSPQDTSGSSPPNFPPKSYGIFSSGNVKPADHEQNASSEPNRYMRNEPSPRGPSKTTGFENPREGRWGNQAEIPRR